MSIIIGYDNTEFTINTILWDRDSFFIDFNNYWARITGSIAQKIAEHTTNNWPSFNEVRTKAVKSFGINPETTRLEFSSPILILPVNTFHFLLASNFNENYEDLILKALVECQPYIKGSIKQDNIKIIKGIKTKHVLVTNDTKQNNAIFLKEADLESFFYGILCDVNKEQLTETPRWGISTVFITSNSYLKDSYTKRGIKNVFLFEDLNKITYKEIQDSLTIHIDGASRGNPGPASIGIAFYKDDKLIKEVSEAIGNKTNNFAEYTALIRALEISREKGFQEILIKSDSELVVNQMNKVYKIKDADIKDLFDKAQSLINKLGSVKIVHVKREENLKADKLANNALKDIT